MCDILHNNIFLIRKNVKAGGDLKKRVNSRREKVRGEEMRESKRAPKIQKQRQTDKQTHAHGYRQGPEWLSNTCPLLFSACTHMLPVWINVSRTVATAHQLPSWFPVCYTQTSPPTPTMMSWLRPCVQTTAPRSALPSPCLLPWPTSNRGLV